MYIADLHIHSRYSRATSRDCTPQYLDLWARKKGIHLVGTGDFTHPAWREELKEKLEPSEDGLYVLKKEYRILDENVSDSMIPRFVVTGEISSIYKKNGRVRKVHSLILLPGLEEAELVSRKLETIGNIHSDGRPILGLDCKDLLEILLKLCPDAVYVPAHIWTPHFSLFGAFSGFDTVEECFEDLSPYIHAVETGLSSDPPMNWRVSALDKFQLISNSDAHSPAKLGREANLLDIELSYEGLKTAIQTGKGLYGTIEFFPEEGKYHMDGHRKCNLCLTPLETMQYGGICPVCKRKLTIGVSHRVEELSDRAEGYQRQGAKPFENLVPLPEVIAASIGVSAASVKVQRQYENMIKNLGPEFEILRTMPLEDIRNVSGRLISEGIGRLREGKVERLPGFDGEYGTIRLFSMSEIENPDGQMDFFQLLHVQEEKGNYGTPKKQPMPKKKEETTVKKQAQTEMLNEKQKEAVRCQKRRIAVIAGPGCGKTKTLISHISDLINTRKVKSSQITAVTFTNQAAGELKERLAKLCGGKAKLRSLKVGTFHAICLEFLKSLGREFALLDEEQALCIAQEVLAEEKGKKKGREFLRELSLKKAGVEKEWTKEFLDAYDRYQNKLEEEGLLDYDDLLIKTLEAVREGAMDETWRKHFNYLCVDEFQDMNPVQYELVKLWNEKGRELFVIGDKDQAIYGFRGSNAACFDWLKKEFEDLEVLKLEKNYRSTPEILSAALHVISNNSGEERTLEANEKSGEKVRIVKAKSSMAEAIFIAKEINRLAGGIGMLEAQKVRESGQEKKERGFDEIAVLYRTHRQAQMLEQCLGQEGIPCVVAGREDFLKEESVSGSIHFFDCLEDKENIHAKEMCQKQLFHLEKNELFEEVFARLWERFHEEYRKKKPQKFLKLWMEEMNLTEDPSMQRLFEMAVFYESMPKFLEGLKLGVESDLKRCQGKAYESGAVTLMTLHGAKGLEFPVVFVCGLQKGILPLEHGKFAVDEEEERRLFYVGMTRASEELILTCQGEESAFLLELPEEVIVKEEADKKKKQEDMHQMSLFE
ncbi:UvrD-helicase domain-containing protein [Lachnoclostridium sp. An181]|uniref:UvrD-helicase domain-containing protein n=1 Tax=Lachnoclostridium sp. An181 TaxID=1965575 RepID=UPI000B36B876|nr:UvrD-helicase domain-containing protein [Lachnoclostridium sp. An181]OUP48989.1 hypothetical protein B5F18_10280 [Lachnoclostridium sp. An181]